MSNPDFTIERAFPASLKEVLEILSTVNLPHEGVEEYLSDFLIARSGSGRIVGCAGLERHRKLGLLRSAAVLPRYQGQGIGDSLVRRLLEDASDEGLTEVVLLTTTAKDYFKTKFGFREAGRENYRERLANSPEWNLPRCSSAAFMTLHLSREVRETTIPPASP
jgi:N-acetylglutamate synthase-like GNAT family acetyltransferase